MPEISPERLAEIKALPRPTTPADAARCWTALQDLLRERQNLVAAQAETTAELATWTGSVV
ncbi:hypothetical protein [Streptomyces odonnellii]|uniref:hypothetical protein n=1 Tax=Streptomyces odonnellii TaxID=1417980 RepID=UPI000625080C|nr:hypothetical protein [Streptomyces odonnellii]